MMEILASCVLKPCKNETPGIHPIKTPYLTRNINNFILQFNQIYFKSTSIIFMQVFVCEAGRP